MKKVQIKLYLEFAFLYIIIPIALAVFLPSKRFAIPVLILAIMPTIFLLRISKNSIIPKFLQDEKQLITVKTISIIFVRFIIIAIILYAIMYHVRPDALFSFPRRSPRHWLIIMIMYPLLSVVPQTLIYRILFVRRYSDLFRTKTATLIIGATVFSLAHAMFKNEVVLIMTFLGGILFLKNYQKSQSLWLNILEHSLYGNLLFTLGYGHYFFR